MPVVLSELYKPSSMLVQDHVSTRSLEESVCPQNVFSRLECCSSYP